MESDILVPILDGRKKPTNLPFAVLKNITDKFSEDREIGQGGFAVVYKGVLPNGGSVAVKRIRNYHTIEEKLFYREVDSLLTINHQNVVRFLGFCASTEQTAIKIEGSRQHIYAEIRERLLCFEYISNGSLRNHITDELRGLEWNMRYQIIKGICEGLHHLHKEKHIYHMDLKPANILLDDYMVPKITDFGLSRLDEKSQTMSENRCGSIGYCAPEYRHSGKMSFKSDMFSLGVIITELVTGDKGPDNDKNNVLRRWRHRWKKTGKETPLVYHQVAKCMEIGLLCQEIDPSKRPFIWDVIHDIRKMEGVNGTSSSPYEYTFGQIRPYSEDDMLGVEPLKLHFPFERNKQISCSLKLTNQTDGYIAFSIQKMSPLPYCTEPEKDIVPPGASYSVDITLQAQDNVPRDRQRADEFTVWSTKVADCLTPEGITTDMFSKESGVVDAVKLDVVFGAEESTKENDDLAAEDRSTDNKDTCVVDEVNVDVVSDADVVLHTQTLAPHNLASASEEFQKRIQNSGSHKIIMDANTAAGLCKEVTLNIHEVYAGRAWCVKFEDVYRGVYYVVSYNHGERMYSAVKTVLASEVEGLLRALNDVAPDGMLFLQELLAKWKLHRKATLLTCDLVTYMDRIFVPTKHKTPVYKLALNLWRDSVVRSGSVLPRLIAEVKREREGEDSAADLASVAEMLNELGDDELYQEVMGAPAVAE